MFSATPPFEVSRRLIAAFADAVGATSPVHHDVDAARAAGFHDVVAPATFSVAITMEAEHEFNHSAEFGVDFTRVVHAEQSFENDRPIVAGDVLHARVTVESVTPRGPLTMVVSRTDVIDADNLAVAHVRCTLAVRGDGA